MSANVYDTLSEEQRDGLKRMKNMKLRLELNNKIEYLDIKDSDILVVLFVLSTIDRLIDNHIEVFVEDMKNE